MDLLFIDYMLLHFFPFLYIVTSMALV
jgi:hypothetical protein